MMANEFKASQEALAADWKARTTCLPEEAKVSAPYVDQRGRARGDYPFCLPREFAAHNLLPEFRDPAIRLFAELGIPWHAGIDGGPSNHLLSSQVQCVNALFPMVTDPQRIKVAFGGHVDVEEVLEIEPGRFLTFEYIGPTDFFDEGDGEDRTRGTMCTSVDAAFKYRTPDGSVELALVEWKYTESYLDRKVPPPGKNATRDRRYRAAFYSPDGPLSSNLVDLEVLFDDPLYQHMRQQLLAWALERAGSEGADVVRVLHVLDPANAAYLASLVRPETRALGGTVDDVWAKLLRDSSRFAHVNPAVFLDPKVTSAEYVDRYSLLMVESI